MARDSISHDGGKKVLARGAIGVDPRAAIAKLREFMLPDPALYVAELVRAVIELGATLVTIENTASEFVLTAETQKPPPSAVELTHLFEHLFSNQARVLRLLAIATNTALGLGPKFVDLFTTTADASSTKGTSTSAVYRVRFVPQNDADEPEFDGKAEAHDPADPMPKIGLRVHVRERFGTSVVREWFGEPVETRVLRERCTRIKAPLVWGKDAKPVATSQAIAPILSVPLGSRLTGELWLVDQRHPLRGTVQFFEQGVLLSTESLSGTDTSLPLAAWIDEATLPTNVSRSAVDRSGALGRTMMRAIDQATDALFDKAVTQLSADQERLVPILRLYLAGRYEGNWLEAMKQGQFVDTLKHMERIVRAPLIPMIDRSMVSLAELSTRGAGAVLEYRGERVPKSELFPWLKDVVAVGGDVVLQTLVSALDCGDAEVAFAQAEESFRRYQRFYTHQPRDPSVNSRTDQVLLRATLADIPQTLCPNPPEKLQGEIAISASAHRGPSPMKVTVFVDGRPLPTLDRGLRPLVTEVAMQATSLTARPDFTGPAEDEHYERALKFVQAACTQMVRAGLEFLADPEALKDNAPRSAWIQPALNTLDTDGKARAVRLFLTSLLEHLNGANARTALRALMTAIPKLQHTAVFRCTQSKLYSFHALSAEATKNSGVLLYRSSMSKQRHPATPVFVLGEQEMQLCELYLPQVKRIDYSRFETGGPESLWQGVIETEGSGPKFEWTNGQGVTGALRIATRNGSLATLHRGVHVLQTAHGGALGPCIIRVEDQRMILGHTTVMALLSADAFRWVQEAEFDYLDFLLRALGGESAALRRLGLDAGYKPKEPVLTFLCLAAARLRALSPGAKRGFECVNSVKDLAARLETQPLFAVRTAQGIAYRSLRELTDAAKRGPLHTLARPPQDVDYGPDFEPIIVAKPELEVALGLALGLRLTPADSQLARRREDREVRIAREAFAQKPTVAFEALGWDVTDFRTTLKLEQLSAIAGVARSVGPTWVQVMHDDRIVCEYEITGNSLANGSVVTRVQFHDSEKFIKRSLDGLTDAGLSMVLVALSRILKRLVLTLTKAVEANPASDVGDSVRSFIQCWCAESARIDDELRPRLARARFWRAVPGQLGSVDNFVTYGKGRVLIVRRNFTAWIAADASETEPTAALIDESLTAPQKKSLITALENISGLGSRDGTDEFDRVQRQRHLLRRATNSVSLEGAGAVPPLRTRIESVDAQLGVGEIALQNDGERRIEWRLFSQGELRRTIVQPGPFSMLVALESSFLSDAKIDSGVVANDVQKRVNDVVRTMIRRAMESAPKLPDWSLDAQQWALLTGPVTTKTLRSAPVFVDSELNPASFHDLEVQQQSFGSVAFTTDAIHTPTASLVHGRRVFLLGERQAGWISAPRVALNYTEALRDEQSALARRKLSPAQKITIRATPPVGAITCELTIKSHDYEGEVALLTATEEPKARVFLYQQRKPLGEIVAPSPWPAWLALEVPELTPNRSETEPIANAALNTVRNKASELVRSVLDGQFHAPASALAQLRIDRGGSPTLTGGKSTAFGIMWLQPDPLMPGRIQYRAPRESMVRTVEYRRQGDRFRFATAAQSLPIGGSLWLSHDAPASGAALELFLSKLVEWAYRQLLAQLAAAKTAEPNSTLAHLVFGAINNTLDTNVLTRLARETLLPESCTTLAHLQELSNGATPLVIERDNPAAAVQERGVILESDAAFFRVLSAVNAVSDRKLAPVAFAPPAPTPVQQLAQTALRQAAIATTAATVTTTLEPTVPARSRTKEPKPKSAQERMSEQLLGKLRAVGVQPKLVEAVYIDDRRDERELATLSKERVLIVYTKHPIVAALLTATDQQSAQQALTIALIGVINRALSSFTDQDELVVQIEMLTQLAAE
jgi:hypothetical protein